MSRRVVITGLGTVNPLGNNVHDFWEGVKENRLGISKVEQFDTDSIGISVAGQVKDFEPTDFIDKKEAKRMERFTQFAVVASDEAIKDSGTDFRDIDPYRAGVIIGCGIGGIGLTLSEYEKFLNKGPNRVSPFYVPMMIGNMAAGQVSMKTGFKGDNFSTVTACASGTHAIGESFRKIKDGYLDVCLCGGTESTILQFTLAGFNNMKALSKTADPARASIPFDKERNGFVLGEGCGMLVLEEYEHAKARGAEFNKKLVSVIGDSTFMHSGITGLVDIVYNKGNNTVIILDNSITGMTGHQDNPTTGYTIRKEETKQVNLITLCKSIGVEHVVVADPFDVKNFEKVVKEEVEREEPSVIIAQRPCALLPNMRKKYSGHCHITDKCKKCKMCMKLGCPAISLDGDTVKIDTTQCNGCGLCTNVCPFGAIEKEEK